jgi:uncharacterized lipoprotein YddW (UPF0748 family)
MLKSLFLAVTIAVGSPGYYTSIGKHIKRWLKSENIDSSVVQLSQLSSSVENEKTVFLVGINSHSQSQFNILKNCVASGGKLVVFHSSSQQLATLLGVKCIGYKSAERPGQWSRIDFVSSRAPGVPLFIRQTSSVLNRAQPMKGSRVIAYWSDRKGVNTSDAAWIESPKGWWMTHVLTADGDETLKSQLVSALVSASEPSKWSAAESFTRKEKERISIKRYASEQQTKKGELRCVWDHSGCGLYPGDWPRTMRILKNAKITDIFVNVAGAGFAHYNSKVLPKSKTFYSEGDQLSACIRAARGSGIRVHAWLLCFTLTRSPSNVLKQYESWRIANRNGILSEYLDPSKKNLQEHLLSAIREIQGLYAVDGIHLDFVRWYENSNRPDNSASIITDFVLKARRAVKRPKWLTAAVLGKYPQCVFSVGQDWASWLDSNLVDYVVPMDYTENNSRFESYLSQHASRRSRAARVIAGIGVTANESRLGPRQVIDQIKLVRKYNLAGVALFDLDLFLEKEILPYLSLGLW